MFVLLKSFYIFKPLINKTKYKMNWFQEKKYNGAYHDSEDYYIYYYENGFLVAKYDIGDDSIEYFEEFTQEDKDFILEDCLSKLKDIEF